MKPTQLFCFPPAAASAMVYLNWQPRLPEEIKIIPMELPGRGLRFREKPFTDFASASGDLFSRLTKKLDGSDYAIFCFCSSCIYGYDVYRELKEQGYPLPVHMFLSSSMVPDVQDKRPPLKNATPDMLLKIAQNLCKFQANSSKDKEEKLFTQMLVLFNPETAPELKDKTDKEVIQLLTEGSSKESPEDIRKLYKSYVSMIDLMIQDSKIVHTYHVPEPVCRFECPVTLFHGKFDSIVKEADVRDWEKYCPNGSEFVSLKGGHMAVLDDEETTLSVIRRALEGGV